ncbi:hypothetical protein [Pseudomonas mosselii]|uniref:hypothetical protein n=1 Tax=Pseudomonas mosselii TaxID=78327 RepID=UPI0021DB5942|nr:hypothetical protein [Pseudomonas mosselii]MCU9527483.1 hypothetical protein [Pseudomonas mosselii]MCU9534796.1 hypothetical protein [Pseudomonas mosselii]MCU9542730.1 hypothetical protein [Pseudomonas mosselii]MCU9546636.1 hypothetical protein [Pseudomonas mosselii]
MPWIKPEERLPIAGASVNCQLRHCGTGGLLTQRLVKVDESDCVWRDPDGYELSYDWSVVQWQDNTPLVGGAMPVGKMQLTRNVLTHDGLPYVVRDSDQFWSFVRTTSAVISTALATVFDSRTGTLVMGKDRSWAFEITGVEPWEQYTAALMKRHDKSMQAGLIAAWCALLSLHQRFRPVEHVEPEAIAFADYITSTAYKAADASPEAVQRWDEFQAWASTTEGAIAGLDGSEPCVPDPWAGAVASTLPPVPGLKHLSALQLAACYECDTVVTGGKAYSCIGQYHTIQCQDDVSEALELDDRGLGGFSEILRCGGVERRFQVDAEEGQVVLRPMPVTTQSLL